MAGTYRIKHVNNLEAAPLQARKIAHLAKPGLMVIALPESHVESGILATVYGMLRVSAQLAKIAFSFIAQKQVLS